MIGALNVERATAKIIQNLIAKYDTHVLKQGVARQHRAVRLNLADRVEGQTQKPTLGFLAFVDGQALGSHKNVEALLAITTIY